MTSVHQGRRGADGWSVVGNTGKKQGDKKGRQLENKELVEHNEGKIQRQEATHDSEMIYRTVTAASL